MYICMYVYIYMYVCIYILYIFMNSIPCGIMAHGWSTPVCMVLGHKQAIPMACVNQEGTKLYRASCVMLGWAWVEVLGPCKDLGNILLFEMICDWMLITSDSKGLGSVCDSCIRTTILLFNCKHQFTELNISMNLAVDL